MHVRRNDQVLVLSGEYRGKKGKVLKVFANQNRVIVEGINFIQRHMRPSNKMPQLRPSIASDNKVVSRAAKRPRVSLSKGWNVTG